MTDVADAADGELGSGVRAAELGGSPADGPSAPAEGHGVAPADGLGKRTARGAVVTLSGQLAQVLLQTASVVVLARLLEPHDYGLYAIGLVVVGIGEIFRDFGLGSAAVQAPILSALQRTNLFWLNTAIGAVLTVVTAAAAPLIADLFHQPALTGVTRWLAITFLINGIATQFRANLNRDMKFGRLASCDLAGQVVGLTTAVVAAALGAHYWALVASQISQVSVILALTVVVSRWRPGRPRRGVPMRHFIRFGRDFVATGLVNYAGNNADVTSIALFLGASPVGVYNRAFQLVMNPLEQFRSPVTTVALPVLSRLQDDTERANSYLRRGQIAMGYTVVVSLALATGLSKPIIHLVLGPRWTSVTAVFAFLSVAGAMQMLAYVGYWAYVSRGLISDLFRYTSVTFVIRLVGVLIGLHWGVTGVAAGFAAAHVVEWPLSLWWLGRRTVYPSRELYLGAGRIIALSSAVGLAAFGCARALSGMADIVVILIGTVAGLAVYALAALAIPLVRGDVRTVKALLLRVVR